MHLFFKVASTDLHVCTRKIIHDIYIYFYGLIWILLLVEKQGNEYQSSVRDVRN